jgi:hypothetical protein
VPVSTVSPTLSIEQTDSRLSDSKWFYTWNVGPFGECTCPKGSYHRQGPDNSAYAGNLDCGANPGKHPWSVWRDGELWGFKHGSQDAISYLELVETYGKPGGRRRYALCLQDIVMIDIDSLQALQTFYRIWKHVPKDKILGVAKTPRGWHVYLAVPEWTQKAINLAMKQWLEDWHGTDASKVSRRGLVLDIRTGPYRYTIWPGPESRDRHWASLAEFSAAVRFAGKNMPAHRMVQDGSLAPWNLVMDDELRERIKRAGTDQINRPALVLDGSEADKTLAWAELERWAGILQKMDPKTGRNSRLNQIAYYAGADAIDAGHTQDRVRAYLENAANGTHGAEATITSGLTSGLRDRYAR